MSTDRWLSSAPFDDAPKLPNGRRRCRWCGTEVPRPRRTWCSDACVEEFVIRKSAGEVRRLVRRRDKGICAICGRDCEAERRSFEKLRHASHYGPGNQLAVFRKRVAELNQAGFDVFRSFWDADHVTPVVEGGGCCGLDGYRTLCQPCHKAETKKLAARRAQWRRTDEP